MRLSGTIENVSQTTLGTQLAVDAHAGDTTLTVVDGSDFNEADPSGGGGGTLFIPATGDQRDYTDIDNDANVITLVSAISADVDAGSRIDVYDQSTGTAAVQPMAHVAVVGGLLNADYVDATVDPTQAAQLALGDRSPGTGEACTVEDPDGDGQWQLATVHGKPSATKLSSIFFTASSPGYSSTVDVDSPVAPFGDVSAFEHDLSGGIQLMQNGWYQIKVSANVTALTSGDILKVAVAGSLNCGEVATYITGWGGDVLAANADTPVFYQAAADSAIAYADVQVISGSSGTVTAVNMYLVKVA